ncbi:MAG: tetratricopeptide repeat protein [Planctomycetota bacterium]
MARETHGERLAAWKNLVPLFQWAVRVEARMPRMVMCVAALIAGMLVASPHASAQSLEELPLDRWKKLRENERYQLQIAEKYYRDKDWKVAVSEYEKYLSLYEKSDAAAYAQLKWSIAQVQLKKHNTAIKEGFQSVLDYWPESAEAQAAGYFLGTTYRAMGQTVKAKSAYKNVTTTFPGTPSAVYAMSELAEMAAVEKDNTTRMQLLRKIVFDTPRNAAVNSACVQAARQLAVIDVESGAIDEAVKALATTCAPDALPNQVHVYSRDVIARLGSAAETKLKAQKSADGLVAYLRGVMPVVSATATDAEKQSLRAVGYAIADILSLSQQDTKVVETFTQLEKSLGASDDLLGRLAAFLKSRSKFEDARAAYRRYQDRFEGLGQVAYSYREQSQFDLAVEVYKQLVGQDAEHANRWRAEMAMTYRSARKFAEAVLVYSELIAADTMNQNKWRWELATTHRDAGQYKEAIAHFRQCDNFPENFRQMAACHRAIKEYNEAVLLYNQIVGADANAAPWALLQIGYTREEAGQKEPAIQTFQQVCKRYPKDSHASVAHAHLQSKYKISITLGGAKDE